MLYYEDLEVGFERTFAEQYQVSEQEIVEFATRWDPQPFHIDRNAAETSIFGGLVASSAHVFCIYVKIGNTEIDRDKVTASASALGFDKLQWHAPIRPGDTLRNGYRVVQMRESRSRAELGIVTVASRMFNQRDETVFTLECTFLVHKRPEAEPPA